MILGSLAFFACGASRYAPFDCSPQELLGFSCNGGYSEVKLSPNTYQVRFESNAFSSRATTDDYTLLRSAELCLSMGYAHFLVLSTSDRTQVTQSYTPPSTAHCVPDKPCVPTGGGTTTTTQPGNVYTIYLIEDPDEYPGTVVYDAASIRDSLRSKYFLSLPSVGSPDR